MYRLASTLIFLLIPFLVISQNFEDSWIGYFSYVSVKSISQGNGKIYGASENAVFTYDLATKEIKTLSSINGLSGESISTLHYSEAAGMLLIGYETGLIEVVKDGEENVLKVVDILEKQTIPPNKKRINNFSEYNGKAYISTQYGISVYNLAALEFGDTYFIGDGGGQINIAQITVQEPYIFAATTSQGIKRALVANENLIDYQQWSTIISGGFLAVDQVGSELYAATSANSVIRFTPQGSTTNVANFSSEIIDFNSKDNSLVITTKNSIQAYSEGFVLQGSINSLPNFEYELQSGYAFNNTFYLGTTDAGILAVPFGTTQTTQILPDGPLNNNPFSLDVSPGQLWVNFGDVTVNYNPYPLTYLGVSNLKDSTWTNIPYQDLSDAVGGDVNDLVDISINPENPDEVYMTSYQKGLLKIVDQTPTVLYDETNSPLFIPNNNEALGIRLFGLDFDKQGNLWFDQSRTNEALYKLSPAGQFEKIDISDIIDGEREQALSEIEISREGYVFFCSAENGVIGYNPTSKKFNKIGVQAGAGNLPSVNTRALAFDAQNRLWIGTLKGLRVLYSPGSFFDENTKPESQPIIILEDGVPQELLFDQSITDIEVDGSNNKWISTATSGVFYISPGGQETLLRFTRDNSPLPSNNILDIAIDSFTGVVYFATSNGIVAYKGTATAPKDNLNSLHAFPNPVRPGFNGNVVIDGLTSQANVKITDIEGNLVYEATSEGGSIQWDTTAFGKYKVRSGVYLILVTTEDFLETKVSKIMIVR